MMKVGYKKTINVFYFVSLIMLSACGGGSTTSSTSPPPPSNLLPSANAGDNQSVNEGELVSLAGSGTDSDGSISSYSWVQTSGINLTITNANTATSSFQAPAISQVTTLVFQLTVTDNEGATGTDSISVTVNPTGANNVPIANAGDNQTVAQNISVNLAGSGIDNDGSITSYSWSQTSGNSVVISNSNSATASFTSPTSNIDITLVFELSVTDNEGAIGKDTVSVIVTTNTPPVADAGTNQFVKAGNIGYLPGKGTDSDGVVSTFKWVQTSGPSVNIFNSNAAVTTFRAPETSVNTDLVFELTVTDNNSAIATDSIAITVEPLDFSKNEIPRVASRNVGVAPLSVFFTAGFSNSSVSNREFHDLEYSWDFGDALSGNWETSSRSKNSEKGPVSSHVFEMPGTYTVNLSIRNETGVIDTDIFTILVLDPNEVFSAERTTCISDVNNNNFEGCPTGANQVVSDNISIMSNYVESGRRILLHRGSVWTQNGTIPFSSRVTTIQIGAFGDCQTPTTQGICSNAPYINVTGTSALFNIERTRDLRITDISLTGSSTTAGVTTGVTDIQQLLILKLKTSGFSTAIGWSHWRTSDTDRIAENSITSCNLSDFNDYGVFIGSERLSLLGNIIYNSAVTHVSRVWNSYQGVIGHNILSGSSLTNSNGRHALKFHGPKEITEVGTYNETGGLGLHFQSKFTMISNNIFGGSGPWPVSVGPQDTGSDERLSDIIIEKNKMLAGYGVQNSTPVQIGLMFEGRYITTRNNILDGTGGATSYTGISVARRGVEPTPLGNRIYNNTIYNNDVVRNGATGIRVDGSAVDTFIRNNLVSFPNVTVGLQSLVSDNSGSSVFDYNLLENSSDFVDPNNNVPTLRNFSLLSTSPAINQGIIVPVFDDFLGLDRTQDIYSLGAYHYSP